MYDWNNVGDPIPALDGFAVDDREAGEDSTVVSVGTVIGRDMIQIAAWDDGVCLDVALLLDLPNARALRDRLTQAIQAIEAGGVYGGGATR
ncbi:hypothetical protein E1293_15450 [Actinomadura darangshiensis]|uniref:Uncharacterized protein n=1 Tax=Actinomadura darangshiensis TaxID=705336 RepID=A0A4R5BE43_9ACTN|nr:hypothetical protein [Actinomadura darangshiensis]TDD83066.1 hypothetical protein E1293_15450 [Actinomadura darangshiensis]